MSVGKVNLPMVDWFQNTPEAAPDDTPDVCDCSGMCNACMDAYICGHEAAILEYCDDCAQCQKSALRTRKAKSPSNKVLGEISFP